MIFALGMIAIVLVGFPALRPVAAACLAGGVLLAPVLYRLNR